MYELVKKVPGVWTFKFSKDRLISVIKKRKNSFHLALDDQRLKGIEIVDPNPICLVSGDRFYYSDYVGNCYEIDLLKKTKRIVADRYITLLDNQENIFLVKTKNGSVHTAIMNFDNGSLLCEFDINVGSFLMGSALFCNPSRNYTTLVCFDKANGNKRWEIDVTGLGSWTNDNGEKLKGELVNIIAEYKNLVLAHITKDKLIAVDVQSGKADWEQDNILSCSKTQELFVSYSSWSQVKSSVNTHLNEEKGEVIFVAAHFLKRMDIASRKIEWIKDFSIEQEGSQWFFSRTRLENNQILFNGSKEVRAFHNCVGIFDLFQSRVTWFYELPPQGKEFFVRAPILHGNRLYASDDQDNLYIFERV